MQLASIDVDEAQTQDDVSVPVLGQKAGRRGFKPYGISRVRQVEVRTSESVREDAEEASDAERQKWIQSALRLPEFPADATPGKQRTS